MKKNLHVVPHNDEWAVRKEGNSRVSKIFERQSDAIQDGRERAIDRNVELIIHSRNGRIREKNSYGNDPRNVKG